MCHKFMLPGVLILKFENILGILLIWGNRNLAGQYDYKLAKKQFPILIQVGIFRWRIDCT